MSEMSQIAGYEEVSSFLHAEKVWIAKLDCGHELRLEQPPERGKKFVECEECKEQDGKVG